MASRIDQRPTWEILLEGARRLMDNGTTAFTRAQLIAHVQHKDPSRDRPSIDPIIQGMTENATGGPPSACGIVFRRVETTPSSADAKAGIPASNRWFTVVEHDGIEPSTSAMPLRRSPS